MKNKVLIGLIATATIGSAIATPSIINTHEKAHIVNKMLMVSNTNKEKTNEAVVINGNSNMNLYALPNGSGIVSNLSTGEMLTILGQPQNGYCKVRVQETGAIGYINVVNMQNILNGTNDSLTQLSGNGQIINVSSNVRLRSNPAIGNNNIIGHLTNGVSLNILGKQGQWYKVNVNGQIGFIYEEYVSIQSSNSNQLKTDNINTNTSSNSSSNSNSTISTNSNNNVKKNIVVRTKSSATSNSSSNVKESFATFSLATINKNCSLYDAPKGEKSLKLNKGDKIFIIDSGFDYSVKLPKDWAFVRTAMGAGYLPLTDFNITNKTEYNVKVLTKNCNLYADTNISTKTNLQLDSGEQVFVPVNESSSSKCLPVICAKTLTTFESGYLPSNILVSTTQISQPA